VNIFVLDENPFLAARYHCDKHVVKMILETAQILSTVLHAYDIEETEDLYKPTHKNHPCTIWAGEDVNNFYWCSCLGLALCDEYFYRYGKRHKSEEVITFAAHNLHHLPRGPQTPFVQAMPEQYRQKDAVEAYRAYYIGEKLKMCTYKNREVPEWLRPHFQHV